MHDIHIIDSHTAGEPTRVVVAGGPDLGRGPLSERLAIFRERHDRYRSAIVNEPRGSDVLVGALLCEPADARHAAGVIFFNNVGYLGMCGHGTIGLVATLAHLGRMTPGVHSIETPVGVVGVTLHDDGRVSVENVASYRKAKDVVVDVPTIGRVCGDVAWAGNWFYLVGEHREELSLANVERLTHVSWLIRQAINAAGYPEVDHVELFSSRHAPRPAASSSGDSEISEGRYGTRSVPATMSRNFVLCPGKAYDRSPCGTGTSAKLACLAADGKLAPGELWVQESILGTHFEGRYRWADDGRERIVPTITGRAFINAEATLKFDEQDPFAWGIGAKGGAKGEAKGGQA